MRLRLGGMALVGVCVLVFASTEAVGQAIDDPTPVTSTASDVISTADGAVSTVKRTVSTATGGGSGSAGSGSGGGSATDAAAQLVQSAPIVGTASGGAAGSRSKPKPDGADRYSAATMTCGEAMREGNLGAFLITMKEGQRGNPSGQQGNGPAGGVAGASAGQEAGGAGPSLPQPVQPPSDPGGFPAWLGFVALLGLGLAFLALIAMVAKSLFAAHGPASAPVAGGAVRRSI